MKSYCMVVKIRRDCMCRDFGMFLTHKQYVVETEQMSSVETGQVCAFETGLMPAVQTKLRFHWQLGDRFWRFIDSWETELGFH